MQVVVFGSIYQGAILVHVLDPQPFAEPKRWTMKTENPGEGQVKGAENSPILCKPRKQLAKTAAGVAEPQANS